MQTTKQNPRKKNGANEIKLLIKNAEFIVITHNALSHTYLSFSSNTKPMHATHLLPPRDSLPMFLTLPFYINITCIQI